MSVACNYNTLEIFQPLEYFLRKETNEDYVYITVFPHFHIICFHTIGLHTGKT